MMAVGDERIRARRAWAAAAVALAIFGVIGLRIQAWLFCIGAFTAALAVALVLTWRVLRWVFIPAMMLIFVDGIFWPAALQVVMGSGALDEKPKRGIDAEKSWSEKLWHETNRAEDHDRYLPYVGWQREDFHGDHVNVSGGLRRTVQHLPAGEPRRRLLVLGGSVVWGHGARDAFTIPSHMGRLMQERGIALEVENRGETAWNSWQSVLALSRQCAEGQIPDTVVLYGGTNDISMALYYPNEDFPHWRMSEWRAWYDSAIGDERPLRAAWASYGSHSLVGFVRRLVAHDGPERALAQMPREQIADRIKGPMKASQRMLEALAKAYGFRAYFFLNAEVSSKHPRTAEEESYISSDGTWYPLRAELLDALAKDLPASGIIDMTRVFEGVGETVFLDPAHISEEGNRRVAQAIVDKLVEAGAIR